MLAGEQAVTTAAPFEWDVDMVLDPERMIDGRDRVGLSLLVRDT